ncbi:MAG: ATP synthase F1 subunit epsilon [Erysipelotrichaceae bacterium]|nr:ATP synthase F1 subunit epsilon [Erysipelotrichaceae bacterium]MCI9313180.1 ATP synthase F1 subunit epsilon [Erysipelotrichaceae bacterium]
MIHLKIITPQGLYTECDVEAVRVRSVEGEMTVLPMHTPLVAMLETCKLSLMMQGQYHDYALAGGLLYLAQDEMKILSDAIEGQAEIDVERAKKAMERAQRRMEKKDSKTNLKRAQVALAKAINRINVSGK